MRIENIISTHTLIGKLYHILLIHNRGSLRVWEKVSFLMKNERHFFMKSERIGFSYWDANDIDLAHILWGNSEVTKFICATGKFTQEEVENRLNIEINLQSQFHIQYWPIFELNTNSFIGCCGLRPHKEYQYEIGFHLRPEFWGKGFASEAAKRTLKYAFEQLHAKQVFAGHNPKNIKSQKLLLQLGFKYIGDEYYPPTGLNHPSYLYTNK